MLRPRHGLTLKRRASGLLAAALIFTLLFVPETKGRSLEQKKKPAVELKSVF